jgi:hypothetical protein
LEQHLKLGESRENGLPFLFARREKSQRNPKMSPPRLKILFVTGSATKLADVKTYLGPYEIIIESTLLDLPEVQAATVEDIARDKCRLAAETVSILTLGLSFILEIK